MKALDTPWQLMDTARTKGVLFIAMTLINVKGNRRKVEVNLCSVQDVVKEDIDTENVIFKFVMDAHDVSTNQSLKKSVR